MTLRQNSVAIGHNNVGGLVNIENIVVDNIPFGVVQDMGNYRAGQEFLRGNGGIGFSGAPSIEWTYPDGGITLPQYYYIYNTLLVNSFTGLLTIRTTLLNPATYVNCNVRMNLRQIAEYLPYESGWLRSFRWEFTQIEVIT